MTINKEIEEALDALDNLHADAQLYQDCDEFGSKETYKEYETIRTTLQRQAEIEGLVDEATEEICALVSDNKLYKDDMRIKVRQKCRELDEQIKKIMEK